MEPTLRLLHSAEQLATQFSTKYRLDPDTTASVAYNLALEAAKRSDAELDSLRLFAVYAARRLVSMVRDECQVFGPSTGALRQRQFVHKEKGVLFQRESSDVLKHVSATTCSDCFDFLERFNDRHQQIILFIIAGYTMTEIQANGFSRRELDSFKEVVTYVYAF